MPPADRPPGGLEDLQRPCAAVGVARAGPELAGSRLDELAGGGVAVVGGHDEDVRRAARRLNRQPNAGGPVGDAICHVSRRLGLHAADADTDGVAPDGGLAPPDRLGHGLNEGLSRLASTLGLDDDFREFRGRRILGGAQNLGRRGRLGQQTSGQDQCRHHALKPRNPSPSYNLGFTSLRLQYPLGRSRVFLQQPGRPDRAGREIAAAVRADAFEPAFDAVGAESAFKGADPRVRAVRREVPVAAFAVRAEVEQGSDEWFVISGLMQPLAVQDNIRLRNQQPLITNH